MSCKITVIVRVDEPGTWLSRLVESLDEQDLLYDEFELVFLVPDLGSVIGRRLTDLSNRRPNVRIAAMSGDPATLTKEVSGEWVLDLGPELGARKPSLFPQALSRLVAFGTDHECQVVLGRSVAATDAVTDNLFVTDHPRLDGDLISLAASSRVIVLRRDLALTLDLWDKPDTTHRLADAGNIGVLGAYPSMRVASPQPAAAGEAVRVGQSTAQWRDGRIVVTVTGSADASGGEALFGIRQHGSGLEYWLPSRTESRAGGEFTGTTEIDVRTAALGSPLGEGIWTLSLGVHRDVRGRHVRSSVPPTPMEAGIVDGIMIVPTAIDARFALDIGATRSGVVTKLSPADVDIAESARGTLLTGRLDRLAVDGDSRIPGSLHLGAFPLPAYLVAEAGRARIECFVSGLAGTSALSAQFGSGKPQLMGLNLVISPTGIMAVAPTPGTSADASTTASPKARAPDKQAAGAPLVVRLRHSVPAPLEPAVRSLARNKVAARLYRMLMSGRAARR